MSQFSQPTKEELWEAAFGIPDDVSWYVLRDDAVRQFGSDWENGYEMYCTQTHGYVPIRIHNVGDPNQWGYAPGPQCVRDNLAGKALPPDVKQWQIAQINACVPFDMIVGATAALNKVKTALPDLPTPKK
jgi:hypothetical protein